MVLYLLFVLAVYCLAGSSGHVRLGYNRRAACVGVLWDSANRELFVFLVPFVGITWRLPR